MSFGNVLRRSQLNDTAPNGWPFSSWLELNELRAAEKAHVIPPISVAYATFLDEFVEPFLHGTQSFTKPLGYSRIIFGYTASWWMGARCQRTRPASGYAISIDAGTEIQLMLAFFRLLAHPEVLPNQAIEPLPPLKQRYALPILDVKGTRTLFEGDPTAPFFPDDAKRNACILQMLFYAKQFIFLHELTHITRGHVDYRVNLIKKYERLPVRERDRVIAPNIHALENIADVHSIVLAAHLANWGGGLIEAKSNQGKFDRVDSDRAPTIEQLNLLGFAIGVVFLLTECFDDLGDTPSGHPSAANRQLIVRAGPAASPEGYADIETEPVLKAINQGISEAESAWDKLGWQRRMVTLDEIELKELVERIGKLEGSIYRMQDM